MEINYLAVLVAALSGFAVGAVWYGPLFGRQWLLVSGVKDTPEGWSFPGVYGITLLLSVVAAGILAIVIHRFDATSWMDGARLGFLIWLGFIATVRFTEGLFNRTNMRLVAIDAGYRLVWVVLMGIIIAAWR